MAFSETNKSSPRPASSAWDIAVTLGSLMSSVGSQCESRNRWPLAPLFPPKLLRQAVKTKPHPETREVSVT